MHLLQSGVPFNVIALWLGHESATTTHRYVEADLSMKAKALARLEGPDTNRGVTQSGRSVGHHCGDALDRLRNYASKLLAADSPLSKTILHVQSPVAWDWTPNSLAAQIRGMSRLPRKMVHLNEDSPPTAVVKGKSQGLVLGRSPLIVRAVIQYNESQSVS